MIGAAVQQMTRVTGNSLSLSGKAPPFRSEPWNSDSDYTQAGIQLEVFLFMKYLQKTRPTFSFIRTLFHKEIRFTDKPFDYFSDLTKYYRLVVFSETSSVTHDFPKIVSVCSISVMNVFRSNKKQDFRKEKHHQE